MRRITVVIAIAAVSLFLGFGSAASAQTATSLPLPPGQGGPDNGINNTQDATAPAGGGVNPATNAGPATAADEGSSLTPWLIGAAVLVLLAGGAVLIARKMSDNRSGSAYSGRTA